MVDGKDARMLWSGSDLKHLPSAKLHCLALCHTCKFNRNLERTSIKNIRKRDIKGITDELWLGHLDEKLDMQFTRSCFYSKELKM
jgi:hypothetical protein